MKEARAEVVRASPWRRVAATVVDWAFYATATAPGLLLLAVSTATWMTIVGGLLLVLPLAAHFTVFAALGNMLGGWLLGVRVLRNEREPVGRLGHLLRWWLVGSLTSLTSLLALPLTLGMEAVVGSATWESDAGPVDFLILPVVAAFLGYNVWLMEKDAAGRTIWDRFMGTSVVEERQEARSRAATQATN